MPKLVTGMAKEMPKIGLGLPGFIQQPLKSEPPRTRGEGGMAMGRQPPVSFTVPSQDYS